MLKITMMLADHAAAADGKLYVNGGGWSITGPAPSPGAIAVDMKIPWDERDHKHKLLLELLDADGQSVLVPAPFGVQPLRIEASLQAQGPFDVKPGTPLDAVFAINYGAIPLGPGARYERRLSVNGDTDEDWTLPFTTRPMVAEAEAA